MSNTNKRRAKDVNGEAAEGVIMTSKDCRGASLQERQVKEADLKVQTVLIH